MPGVQVPKAREKKDSLGSALQMASIAQSISGIDENMEKSEERAAEKKKIEEQERREAMQRRMTALQSGPGG